jgi:hypothetical protein
MGFRSITRCKIFEIEDASTWILTHFVHIIDHSFIFQQTSSHSCVLLENGSTESKERECEEGLYVNIAQPSGRCFDVAGDASSEGPGATLEVTVAFFKGIRTFRFVCCASMYVLRL